MVSGSSKIFSSLILLCIVFFSLLFNFIPTWAAEGENCVKTISRRVDPVVFNGEMVPEMLGKALDKLMIYAVDDGCWRQVIYQFDERRPNGDYYYNLGEGADDEEANKILDKQDQIGFYAREAGGRALPESWPQEAGEGVEVKLIDPLNQQKGWVYLFYYPKDRPERRQEVFGQLAKWDIWEAPTEGFQTRGPTWAIDGAVNKVGKKYYKTPFNKTYMQPKSAGGSGENILDRQKCRLQARLFFGVIKININEDNAIGGIYALGYGPVRGFGRMWGSIPLPMGLEGPKGWIDIYCYDTMIIVPNFLRVPVNPGTLLTDASLSVGYDLNKNAYGMKFYNSNNLEGFLVDGKTDKQERAMNTALDKWRCITGPQGTMITRSDWDQHFVEQAEISVHFEDDIEDKHPPEDVSGKIGYFHNTSRIASLEPYTYYSQLDWYFPDHFYDPDRFRLDIIEEYLNIKGNPIRILVDGKSCDNLGGQPGPLKPSVMR